MIFEKQDYQQDCLENISQKLLRMPSIGIKMQYMKL